MQVEEILRAVVQVGGELWAAGDSLRYRLPKSALPLVDELRAKKLELLESD